MRIEVDFLLQQIVNNFNNTNYNINNNDNDNNVKNNIHGTYLQICFTVNMISLIVT